MAGNRIVLKSAAGMSNIMIIIIITTVVTIKILKKKKQGKSDEFQAAANQVLISPAAVHPSPI